MLTIQKYGPEISNKFGGSMTDLEVARVLLYRNVNKALEFQVLHTRDLIEIMKDFLTVGCKNHNDYKFMINELFKDDYYFRDILLKN